MGPSQAHKIGFWIGVLFLLVAGSACQRRDGGEPGDYVPRRAGTKWVYKIAMDRNIEPLKLRETTWPMGSGGLVQITRGLLTPFGATVQDEDNLVLSMRVKGNTAAQGPLEYPEGVEIAIERDDLGVYEEHKQVFWAISQTERFSVDEVVTYPRSARGAPPGGHEDGHTTRVLFFDDKPGIQIGFGEKPREMLAYAGLDTQAPECGQAPCRRFLRKVQPAEEKNETEGSDIDKGFTEDRWFAKGKGLVRLEQKVEGKTSMVWTLQEFSSPK